MTKITTEQTRRWPIHGWLGIVLIVVFWVLNWWLPGTRSHWGFFPLWVGYSLTVDALVFLRKGHSLLTRTPGVWAALFLISAPAWWLFELINLRTQNWIYLGEETFSTFEYAAFSTLCFSTVMPAVFGTAEWVGTWEWVRQLRPGLVIRKTPSILRGFFTTGILMLLLVLAWPEIFFPLVWCSVYCIIEPLNVKLGCRSLLDDLALGDWRPLVALSIGCLICGFFWEMWNFYSWPKWVYRIPYADVFHAFEMPIAGYLGYIPFSLELFALYQLVVGLFMNENAQTCIHLVEE
jgi:hypothetical protein